MARVTEFVRHVLELMGPLGEIRARAMFGGFGVYRRDTFFAIIVDDTLYFKTDAAAGRKCSKLGLRPFTYVARGRQVALRYHEALPEVFESPEVMRDCALDAIRAARQVAGRTRKQPSAAGKEARKRPAR